MFFKKKYPVKKYHGTTLLASNANTLFDLEKILGKKIPKTRKVNVLSFGYSSSKKTITELSLSGQRLSVLPDSIGNLQSLKKLFLSSNRLVGLPTSFANLTSLELLDVSFNFLTSFPLVICQCYNLRYLNLEANIIKYLPKELLNLKQLKILGLDEDEFDKANEDNIMIINELLLRGCQVID